ncbi:globin [Paenibacillus sp.]|uniref:globin domain-containing protein n=1 Tax=Paenibacillus sp. TaxID=58172 RepID=UPI002D23CD59|nr:globin [Paenibacillus sp.]HZG57100.1 globin [Paenibacillus sp.]
MAESTVFDELGGEATVSRLVDAFYDRVVRDEKLSPLFAGRDIEEVKRKQAMFLTQFLGGPPKYSEEFGHPMLRARHMPFPITTAHAEAWLACMAGAMDEIGLAGGAREFLFARLTQTAHHMVNTADDSLDR